jgi:hypothetical protein
MMIFVSHMLLLVSLQPLQGGVRGLSKENGDGGHFALRMANAGGGVKGGTDDSSFRDLGPVDSLLKIAGISGTGVDDEEQVGFIVLFYCICLVLLFQLALLTIFSVTCHAP